MIAAWILYASLFGALLGAGASALEWALRTYRKPARWIWLACVLVCVAWPPARWMAQRVPVRPVPATVAVAPSPITYSPGASSEPTVPVRLEVAERSALRRFDRPLLIVWAALSAGLGLFALLTLVRTRRLTRGWRRVRVGDQEVYLSDEWGPAVVGFLRPRVVLPGWASKLDQDQLRLVLDHEIEHIRAGDLWLLGAAGLLPIVFPWNLALWWQLSRLRSAVESDCDLRVLQRHPGHTRAYIHLLLELGSRPTALRPAGAMLSEPYSTLKRRIRTMTMPRPRKPRTTGVALSLLGFATVVFACTAPAPTDSARSGDGAANPDPAVVAGADGPETVRPIFTPYSRAPELANRDDVITALRAAATTESEGSTGVVYLRLNADGEVEDFRIDRSTGSVDLDRALLDVAFGMTFSPALNRDQERAVWVSLPVAFGASVAAVADRGGYLSAEAVDRATIDASGDAVGSVAGVVRDQTGAPMRFVQLFVPGTGRGTLSSEGGRFLIPDVPLGAHEVVAHLIGYAEARVAVTVSAESAAEVELPLRETAIGLEPLVVPLGG